MNHVASRPELGRRLWSWNVLTVDGVDLHLHAPALALGAIAIVATICAGYAAPVAAAAMFLISWRAAWLRASLAPEAVAVRR